MNTIKLIFITTFVFFNVTSRATTWDEPWQDKVIKEAEYFVFAKIKSSDPNKGITLEIIKTLSGQELKGKIKITDFYLLHLCSSSKGHGPEFHFERLKECYFFIKKNEAGKYCIATPTTGFDYINEGKVYANYRHSYHKAIVPIDIYEKTMTAIFNNYHNLPYDKQFIIEYIDKNISLKPAGFASDEINTFFAQHVALECAYHLRLEGFYAKILPFLADTANFHNRVSAARALISYNTLACKQALFNVISDTTANNFVQVICIWTLSEYKPTELKEELIKVKETASKEELGFGSDIMDPRVCTFMPDVKTALEKLIKLL